MTIALTNALLRDAIAQHLGKTPAPGKLHLFGLRGCIPVAPDRVREEPQVPDVANDTLGMFGSDFLLVRGSVDPGATYTWKPLHPLGCAHLVNGIYRYERGLHRGRPAFRQGGEVRVWRDADRDFVWDASEKPHDPGFIGLNIHAMGQAIQIGPHSAGCQVVLGGWQGAPWTQYRDTAYAAPQPDFFYHLLDFRDLVKTARGA